MGKLFVYSSLGDLNIGFDHNRGLIRAFTDMGFVIYMIEKGFSLGYMYVRRSFWSSLGDDFKVFSMDKIVSFILCVSIFLSLLLGISGRV